MDSGRCRTVQIAPGAVHLPQYLADRHQRALVDECRSLINGPVPAYVPTVRGGGRMHVRMLCLGRHWNGTTYQYETARCDHDGATAPDLPPHFRQLAAEIANAAGMTVN